MSKSNQLARLHNRHLAKILTQLQEINIPVIAINAVKQQFSYYTKDIQDQVLNQNYDQENNR